MKILIISHYFFPTNTPRSHRTTELAKEFARQGHNVTVIFPTNGYDYNGWKTNYPTLAISPTDKLKWRSISIQKTNLTYWATRIGKRVLSLFFEYPSIEWYFKMPQIVQGHQGYDLLISIAVPHPIHWGIARCKKKGILPARLWIADCGDPYMGVKTDSFRPPFYFSWFEKLFCRYADFITIPVESAKEGYYPMFHDKFKVIPQGFNYQEIKLANYRRNKCIHFCYAGGFIPVIRDPRPILEVLTMYEGDFRFYIFTHQKDILADYADRLQGKMIISDYIPRLELIKFMSTMDFLLNIENGTAIQVPSKLIDYSLSKRPILSLASGDIDTTRLNAFLHFDFSGQTVLEHIEDYNIIHITKKIIDLSLHRN